MVAGLPLGAPGFEVDVVPRENLPVDVDGALGRNVLHVAVLKFQACNVASWDYKMAEQHHEQKNDSGPKSKGSKQAVKRESARQNGHEFRAIGQACRGINGRQKEDERTECRAVVKHKVAVVVLHGVAYGNALA